MATVSAVYMQGPRPTSALPLSLTSLSQPSSSSSLCHSPADARPFTSSLPAPRDPPRSPRLLRSGEAKTAFVKYGSKTLAAGRAVSLPRFRKMCAQYRIVPTLLSDTDVDDIFCQALVSSEVCPFPSADVCA